MKTIKTCCDECTCNKCPHKNNSRKCTRCIVCDGQRPKTGPCYKS